MKYLTLLFNLTLLLCLSTNVIAQQSDYQIIKDFEAEYSSLKSDISNSYTLSDLDSLSNKVLRLQLDYQGHNDLIDDGLYPLQFSEIMNELNELVLTTEHRLVIIENQQEQIDNLSDKLSIFEFEINTLRTEAKSLRSRMESAIASEDELKSILKDYKTQIEQRDRLILAFVDTLLNEYKELKKTGNYQVNEVGENQLMLTGIDLVSFMQTIIDDYKADEKLTVRLGTEELVRMYLISKQFEEILNETSTELISIGSEESRIAELESSIFEWQNDLEDKTWSSIQKHLQALNIETDDFYDKITFITALEAHIRMKIDENKDDPFLNNQYEEYLAFDAFWNDFMKSGWGEPLIESGLISTSQVAQVDASLSDWYALARPQSYTLQLIIGFGILLILILSFVIYKLY